MPFAWLNAQGDRTRWLDARTKREGGAGRESGALSRPAGQPIPSSSPAWKQEVNRRVAEHKSRRVHHTGGHEAHLETRHPAGSQAALAAARVAARFSRVSTFSQVEADEERKVVEAAAPFQAAPEIERETKAAAVGCEESGTEQKAAEEPRATAALEEPVIAREASEASAEIVPEVVEARSLAEDARNEPAGMALAMEMREEPLAAFTTDNLIEFPKEERTPRRRRSREASAAVTRHEGQLSIWEVVPEAAEEARLPAAEPVAQPVALPRPEPMAAPTAGIVLEEQQAEAEESREATAKGSVEIHLAPFGRRLLAGCVDATLIAGAFSMAALVAGMQMDRLPSLRLLEIGGVVSLLIVGLAYEALFFALTDATPGMKYAHVSLCTFEDEFPSRWHLRARLGAMVLSLAPLGLGMAWGFLDDAGLSWHDRLSRTYLRMSDV